MRPAKKRKQTRDEMRPSYDFSRSVRGKYVTRLAVGTNIVVLDADVAEAYKTSKDVNAALRSQLKPKRRRKVRG